MQEPFPDRLFEWALSLERLLRRNPNRIERSNMLRAEHKNDDVLS